MTVYKKFYKEFNDYKRIRSPVTSALLMRPQSTTIKMSLMEVSLSSSFIKWKKTMENKIKIVP